MASSLQAALHMDQNYEKNLELLKNSEFESIKVLFGITRMMIEGNSEIKNVFPADVASSLWKKPEIKWTKARVHGPEDTIKRWNDQVSTLKMCHIFRELQGLNGELEIFPGATALDILQEIQADLKGKHVTSENFSDRIIFMSMFNDIVLKKKDNEDFCAIASRKIKLLNTCEFIILLNTNNIVMWVILSNNADWDYFKTLTSREILKIGNPLLGEHCAFLEVIHLFQ